MNNPLRHLYFSLFLSFLLLGGVSAAKYQEWFWWYVRDGTFPSIVQDTCKNEYDNYMNSTSTPDRRFNGSGSGQWCVCIGGVPSLCYTANKLQYFVEDCILAHLRPSYLTNYQAAAVIFGILPGLLGAFGARLSEITYLSIHRPVLSFLLALGSPAVWPTRLLEYDDPVDTVKEGLNKLVMQSWRAHPWASALLSASQYLLAAGSIANMMEISLQLGKKSVLVWSCEANYGPLVWALCPVVIHLLAAITYNIETRHQRVKVKHLAELNDGPKAEKQTNVKFRRPKTFVQAVTAPLDFSWWSAETTLCANRKKGLAVLLREHKTSDIAVFVNCVASVLAFSGYSR